MAAVKTVGAIRVNGSGTGTRGLTCVENDLRAYLFTSSAPDFDVKGVVSNVGAVTRPSLFKLADLIEGLARSGVGLARTPYLPLPELKVTG